MSRRSLHASGLIASTVALVAALTGAASAESPIPEPIGPASRDQVVVVSDAASGTVCSRHNGAPDGRGLAAQTFGPSFELYDSVAAADFSPRRRCTVTSVYIDGRSTYEWGGANSIKVWIRKDALGLPGETQCTAKLVGSGPDFTVPVSGCTLKRDRTYWLAVQVDQDYESQGQWWWAITLDRVGLPEAWKNPIDGFETGCTEWTVVDTCFGIPIDLRFTVYRG